MERPNTEHSTALAIATFRHKKQQVETQEHIDELALLSETYGVPVIHKELVHAREYNASTFISQGKLEELIELAKSLNVSLILFDDEISPAQQRNLERRFELTVMDRTELILEVFYQRAQTKEAHLQIELAHAQYQFPRLKRMWTHLSRQTATAGTAGGAYLKGVGEKQIEIDRRLLEKRIAQLKKQLSEVEQHRETQRSARHSALIPIFAIVGYTNAGKSTLINALTDAGTFVEDKLFATLDTTTRKMHLSCGQELLLIDTVGFIRKLPHQLVAAFKSTLEEAIAVDVLLHVIDVTHHAAMEQAETTLKVLKELGAANKPIITLLNKIDLLEDQSVLMRFRLRFPKCVAISAKERLGFDALEETIRQEIKLTRQHMLLKIPYVEQSLVYEIQRNALVHSVDYTNDEILIDAELPVALAGRLRKYSCE
ncbi:MAG: GTPase HflX [Chlamydiia bacterium]|nr:GTPase HflX [Chlamydiia bacterium]